MWCDIVRSTAAGLTVPIQFRTATKQERFWVTDADRDRLQELYADDIQLPPAPDTFSATSVSGRIASECHLGAAVITGLRHDPDETVQTQQSAVPP
ncbi:hypothetical protein [Streptomyces longwoodensis]|uniref:hypothetical protein n=1 Tax=Streptomyces longwoodensis TaxID=68231 RepID=UPI0033D163B3